MSQPPEPKKENEIPSGKIEWRTDDASKKVEISADGNIWLDVKIPKPELIAKIKEQLNKDKKNDEEKAGFTETETGDMNLGSGGGKKSKKRRNKNKKHTRKNKNRL